MKKIIVSILITVAPLIHINAYNYFNQENTFGTILHAGYSFADNGYLEYGANIYYKFSDSFGLITGFNALYGTTPIPEEPYYINKPLPMWNANIGFILGKFFYVSAVYGQCNICKLYNTAHTWNNYSVDIYKQGNYFGVNTGFLFPIPKTNHVGINVNLSYTTHTSFTPSAGVIFYVNNY